MRRLHPIEAFRLRAFFPLALRALEPGLPLPAKGRRARCPQALPFPRQGACRSGLPALLTLRLEHTSLAQRLAPPCRRAGCGGAVCARLGIAQLWKLFAGFHGWELQPAWRALREIAVLRLAVLKEELLAKEGQLFCPAPLLCGQGFLAGGLLLFPQACPLRRLFLLGIFAAMALRISFLGKAALQEGAAEGSKWLCLSLLLPFSFPFALPWLLPAELGEQELFSQRILPAAFFAEARVFLAAGKAILPEALRLPLLRLRGKLPALLRHLLNRRFPGTCASEALLLRQARLEGAANHQAHPFAAACQRRARLLSFVCAAAFAWSPRLPERRFARFPASPAQFHPGRPALSGALRRAVQAMALLLPGALPWLEAPLLLPRVLHHEAHWFPRLVFPLQAALLQCPLPCAVFLALALALAQEEKFLLLQEKYQVQPQPLLFGHCARGAFAWRAQWAQPFELLQAMVPLRFLALRFPFPLPAKDGRFHPASRQARRQPVAPRA